MKVMDYDKINEEDEIKIKKLIEKRNKIFSKIGIDISFPTRKKEKKDDESSTNTTSLNEITEMMKSGIIGFSVGDALGVPVEFLQRSILKQQPHTEMIGYGSHNMPSGTWSDDTSLLIAAMDSIIENGEINFDDIMHRFTEWVDFAKYTATDVVFDIGISTQKAIINYKRGIPATNCGTTGIRDNGNGSLMRILPFAYYLKFLNYSEEEKVNLINQASSLTHAHEISCLGCKIFVDYITLLLDKIDKNEAIELLKNIDYSKYYTKESINEYRRILNGNIGSLNADEIKSSGYVVHSLEASLWCTIKNNNYEDAIIAAVNLGEDTDTIGAIAGAMNGIIYGQDNIPKRWLEKLKKREYLENLANNFTTTIQYGNKKRI